MKTTLSERDGNTVKLAVEVSSEELREAFDNRLRQLAREVRLPGFRPGKAPVAMVRQRLGDETILIDAVDESMSGWLIDAMAELGLEAVDRPQVDLDDEIPALDKPLGFKATVTVMPEVILGEYKGVKVTQDPVAVEDSEVDAQMERLRNEFAELRPVADRGVQKGDFIAADLRVALDGKPVEDLEATDYVFEVGGGHVFEEVEAQVIDMQVDEEKTFPVELPAAYPEDLGGKTVDFTIKVKDVKERELPPLTDKWASEISEFATLLELRQEIRSKMQTGKENAAQQRFIAMALRAAVDNAEVDLPDVMVRSRAEDMLADFKRSLESQGGTLEGYTQAADTTVEKIVEDMKPQAADHVKTGLVLSAIAEAEELTATDEEVSAMVAQMAAATRTDAKALERKLLKSGRFEDLREQIVRDKAVDFIAKNAVSQPPEPIDFTIPESVKAAVAEQQDASEKAVGDSVAVEAPAEEPAVAGGESHVEAAPEAEEPRAETVAAEAEEPAAAAEAKEPAAAEEPAAVAEAKEPVATEEPAVAADTPTENPAESS